MTPVLMPLFKEGTERRKTSFLKETEENADLHKAVLNKTQTTKEFCSSFNVVINIEQSFKTTLAFVAKLEYSNNIQSTQFFYLAFYSRSKLPLGQ